MTIVGYDRIVQRAEILATSTDWQLAADEFQVLEKQLKALGPPADPSDRQRVWAQFDGARRRFISAHAASTPVAPVQATDTATLTTAQPAPSRRPAPLEFIINAFVGYLRPFSYRRRDTRQKFWTFALIGLPLGAVLIVLLSQSLAQADFLAITFFAVPVLLLACWWTLALIAATARRLGDSRLPRAIAAGWLLIPAAFVIAAILALWVTFGDTQHAAVDRAVFDDRWALFMTIAAICAIAIAAGIIYGCALPSKSVPADNALAPRTVIHVERTTAPGPTVQPPLDWRIIAKSAFRGYVRTFRFRSTESRVEYWSFVLIGVPIGAAIMFSAFQLTSQGTFIIYLTIPAWLFVLWWLLSLTAATARRLRDAGASWELALILPFLPLAFGINELAVTMLTWRGPGQSSDLVSVFAAVWAAITIANILIACAMGTGRIVKWGNGIGPLVWFSVLPAALPLLIMGAIFALIAGLGSSSATTAKVSGSTRRGSNGRMQRVRQYERRTGSYSQSARGSISSGVSKFLGLGAVGVLILIPAMVWQLKLVPRPKIATPQG